MATCNESILGMDSFDGLTEIIPNTITPFNATASENMLFKLLCPQIQTVKFNINSTSSPVALTITAFLWDGSTASPVGSINITTPNAVAYIDFNVGNYIICVRPTGFSNQSGSFVAEFTGYTQEAKFSFDMYSGESLDAILSGPPTPPRECNEALFFELIDGDLPPGLQMSPFGVITGVLPNLDCLPDRWSPAVNWYYDENDGTTWPWGREWRFQVRVTIDGQPAEVNDVEWFCIRIHNNWTFDAERFLADAPFENITHIKVVEAPPALPTVCQPCKKFEEEARFVPQKLPQKQNCPPCVDNQETRVELIPIPLDLCQIPASDFLNWYIENKSVDSGNPNIEKFKRDLEESPAFTILRARAGYIEPDELTPQQIQKQFIIAQNYQNFLQLSSVILNEGIHEEYRSIIREWQVLENQVLPYQAIGYSGEGMMVSLK